MLCLVAAFPGFSGRAGKADGGALLSVAAAEAVVLSGRVHSTKPNSPKWVTPTGFYQTSSGYYTQIQGPVSHEVWSSMSNSLRSIWEGHAGTISKLPTKPRGRARTFSCSLWRLNFGHVLFGD